ncbi:MAG: hypothetical protein U0Z75_08055 [Deinococcaceae bacterium]
MKTKAMYLGIIVLCVACVLENVKGETLPLPMDVKPKIQFPGGDGTANNNGNPGEPPATCAAC